MVESKAVKTTPAGRWMTRPVCFMSGRARQAIASSRSGSKRSRWQLQLPRDRGRPGQGVQALEPLPDPPAEPPGLRLGGQRLEQVLAALPRSGDLDRRLSRRNVQAAMVEPIDQDRRQHGGPDAGRGQARVPLAPPPEPLARARPAATGSAGSPGTAAAHRASSRRRREPVLRVLGQRLEHQRLQVARDAAVVLSQRHRRLVRDLVDEPGLVPLGEGRFQGQQLVERRAQRVDVAQRGR